MKEHIKKLILFLFTWVITWFGIVYLGILGYMKINEIPQKYSFLRDIVLAFSVSITSFAISYFKFSLDTRKKFDETHTKIGDLTQKTLFQLTEIKRSLRENKKKCVTADNFFETRIEDETFEETINLVPKSIKYSGGNMDNLIDDLMLAANFTKYIINDENVEVQFLFPDPNNNNVIENLVKNVTIGNQIETYKAGINNAVKKLDAFIKENNLKSRVKYRFYKFVPSFGLKIISEGSNDRLYVDLYTYGIAKADRYCFKIEKVNSERTYEVFKNQYEKLWEISNEKPSSEKKKFKVLTGLKRKHIRIRSYHK